MGCGGKCAKYLLIIFNLIFWLAGAGLLALGIWLLVDPAIVRVFDVVTVGDNSGFIKYAIYVMLGAGGFMFIVGFLGCCGAIRESKALLGLYIFCLLLVMGAEIAAGVLALLKKDEITDKLRTGFQDSVKELYNKTDTDKQKAFTTSVDVTQQYFECCGAAGSSDFGTVTPWSCYAPKDTSKPILDRKRGDHDTSKAFSANCETGIKAWFQRNAIIVIAVAIGIAGLELLGLIFAICLCRTKNKEV